MTYPRTLDEIPSAELVAELAQRQYRRMGAHVCPYCQTPLNDPDKPKCTCQFGDDLDKYHGPYVLQPLQYGGSCQ